MVDISGEDGVIIAGESGIAIAGDVATSNNDQQVFNFSVNLLAALLWQYTSAVNLQSILQQKQQWYDENQTAFWEDWITNVFNLTTANEFGLDVWSVILNFPLFNNQGARPATVLSFGFGSSNGNFGNSNFGSLSGTTINLPLETKRIALQLRYFQLCSSGTVPEINRFMNFVFQNYGKVYLVDFYNMTQQYVFLFPLDWSLKYLFDNFDILPRPAGVLSGYRDGTVNTFGFGPLRLGFGQGNFG
jgi:uncharacterized protein DUF2612